MADRIVAVVWVWKITGIEHRQPIQIQYFLKAADFIPTQVEVFKYLERVQTDTNDLNIILR